MPRIVFECPTADVLAVDAADGSRLIDVCDEAGAEVPFSCRSASCGTCRVAVVLGVEALVPAAEDERELLAMFDDDPNKVRLACQARLRPGADQPVRIRVLAFDE